MKFWNIGAEGQILVGAIAAGWFGLFTATIFPKIPLVLLMMASSMILGGLYGLLRLSARQNGAPMRPCSP